MTKSLAILEYADHCSRLKEEIGPDALAIGLTPYAAYELERQGVRYKNPGDYLNHQEFFGTYRECTARLLDFLTTIDGKLWQMDGRFKERSFKPFFLSAYQFKTPVDTVQIYIYLFTRIFKQERPQEVFLVSSHGLRTSRADELSFHMDDAVVREVVAKLSRVFGFKLTVIEVSRAAIGKRPAWFQVLKRLKNGLQEMMVMSAKPTAAETKVLTVDVRDLDILADALKDRYAFDHFPHQRFASLSGGIYKYESQLMAAADGLKGFFNYQEIEFYDLIRDKIVSYVRSLETCLARYDWLDKHVRNYDMVVLNTLSPYAPANPLLADICRKKNIPCACWMHGGFGANQSFEGYDTTDLMLADHYLTYGNAVNRVIEQHYPDDVWGEENWKKVTVHYPKERPRCLTAGAPWIEDQMSGYTRPEHERRTILFIMGELWEHNQYYMGGNSPNTYFQKWEQVKKILRVLVEHQERYDVIIKTYPGDVQGQQLLKSFLSANGGKNIRVIRNEAAVHDLLKRCDLTVSTWVSTTFFQAALTDADQFLFDDSDLSQEAKKILGEDFFFSANVEDFCRSLGQYLEQGKFYQKSKEGFRNEYLDQKNKQNRVEYIDQCLQSILRKKGNHAE